VDFTLGDYDSAIAYALKFQQVNPTFLPGDTTLAEAYAMKGDREHARAAMETELKADPSITISASIRFHEDPANHLPPEYQKWFRQVELPALRLAERFQA
jgi:tetratricopeptide (TPR) repeat protein